MALSDCSLLFGGKVARNFFRYQLLRFLSSLVRLFTA
jgi:hypothetical protein